jgi:hypothetical protein
MLKAGFTQAQLDVITSVKFGVTWRGGMLRVA